MGKPSKNQNANRGSKKPICGECDNEITWISYCPPEGRKKMVKSCKCGVFAKNGTKIDIEI